MRCLFLLVMALALFLPLTVQAQPSPEIDEAFLRQAGLPTDTDNLLEYFRRHSLKEVDRARLKSLVGKLTSFQEADRERAQKELTLFGAAAVPVLKEAENHPHVEVKQRVQKCLQDIEMGKGPEIPAAAARLLAQRQATAAIDILFTYLSRVDDDNWSEEILTSLGQLTIRQGKIDPLLLAALKSPLASRRGTAVYILARRGGMAQRETVRQFLADAEPQARLRAMQGLLGKRVLRNLEDLAAADLELVRQNQVGTDESSLLDFLRKRTLSEADQEKLRQLVQQLGDASYQVRQGASRQLYTFSTPALTFLKPALDSTDLETARRARQIMTEIQRGPGPALPAAVIRLLARPHSSSVLSSALAIHDLLAYVPFADDESVEEEVLHSLAIFSLREVKVDTQLVDGLQAQSPARRAAAAQVLGLVGTSAHAPMLRKLLDDPAVWVRWRTAQGLLAAHDKAAVPRLISLLVDAPSTTTWQVDDILHRLAGERPPAELVGDAPLATRQKAAKLWEKWWQTQAASIDLARWHTQDQYLGLTTICEYDSINGQPGGQVWECGRDGKPRWRLQGIMGPMDAQVLPNGRVLIAENSGQKVTERDLSGNIKWFYNVQGNPIACQRLPNGNTFIATYNQVLEVTPSNEVKYSINRGPGFYIFSAKKLPNNHVVCITAQGIIMEFEVPSGKEIRSFSIGQTGGWCSVEALPNGRYLVATMSNGQVRELDATGKSHWQCQFQGAFRAARLPNGNTLVASMTTRKVAEFDRAGQVRWEHTCNGRPWSLRFR